MPLPQIQKTWRFVANQQYPAQATTLDDHRAVLLEATFDEDYPGHYMRRLKSVGMSVESVNAPLGGVNAKLTLQKSRVRHKAVCDEYADYDANHHFFFGPIQSVVTSGGQSDSGMFEVNLRDDRLLPFEGAGAISTWAVRIPQGSNKLDLSRLNDIVLHVRFTARDGGEVLAGKAREALAQAYEELDRRAYRLFSIKEDFGDAWSRFLEGEEGSTEYEHVAQIELPAIRFQRLLGSLDLEVTGVEVFLKLTGEALAIDEAMTPKMKLIAPDGDSSGHLLVPSTYGVVRHKKIDGLAIPVPGASDTWTLKLSAGGQGPTQPPSGQAGAPDLFDEEDKLLPGMIEDVWLLFHYKPPTA